MRTVEIIHLRSSLGSVQSLSDQINESLAAEGLTTQAVTVYRRVGLETDLAVHIRQPTGVQTKRAPRGESILGLRLAAALKTFGLVEHTVWEPFKGRNYGRSSR